MRLTRQQQTIITEKFKSLNAHCAFCGQTNFTVVDKLFELREFHDGNLVLGADSSTIPAVVLVCNNCSEIRLFSALNLGVIDNTEKKVVRDGEK